MLEYNLSKIKLPVWFTGLFFILVCFFVYRVSDIIALFVYGLICAYFLDILVRFIEQRGLCRSSSIIVAVLLAGVALFILWIFLFPPLVKQMTQIKEGISVYISDIHAKGVNSMKRSSPVNNGQSKIEVSLKEDLDYLISGLSVKYPSLISSLGGREQVSSFIFDKQQQIVSFIISLLGDFSAHAVSFLSHIFNLIFVPILCIYFLFAKESLKKRIVFIIDKTPYRHEILSFFDETNSMLTNYLKGQLSVMVLTSIVITLVAHIVSSFFGTKYSLFLGCLTGFTCVIPYFGALISMVTAALLCLATASHSPFVAAIVMLVLMIVVNQVFDSYLTPKIVGHSIGIHPLFSIFALLVGGKLAGFIGMLLAAPVAGVVNILVLRIWPQMFTPLSDRPAVKSEKSRQRSNSGRRDSRNKEYHPKAIIRIPPGNPNNMSPYLINDKKNEEGMGGKNKSAIQKSLNVPKRKKEAPEPPSLEKPVEKPVEKIDESVQIKENKQENAKPKGNSRIKPRYYRTSKNKEGNENQKNI